ncbi:MAG TPA: LuxR C-terminal-related transcriptional regulator [Candidatus Limnocylindrales bacterium]|nr:LuxR C-terminal-related transcriptional regulator [Candidatus Limnocylindrales bacterium]
MQADVLTVTPAIGRDQLLADLTSLMSRERGVTLTGPGGIGKTTVAMALTRTADRPDRPAVFVDLSGVDRAAAMSAPVAAAIDVAETAESDLDLALDDRLASGAALLVLDNLEQVVDARRWIDARLTASPSLQVLATSRVPVRYALEHERAVPPLGLPADPSAGAVASSAAGALFLARSRAIGREHRLDGSASADVFRLLERLDGIPLAIELAAGRSRVLSPAAMLDRLDSVELLSRPGGADDRHASLGAVLSWSIDLLTPQQRTLLEALVAWTGPFDPEVAEALAPSDGDVLSDLDALIETGLVSAFDGPDREIRFRVLETVRATVRGRVKNAESHRAVAASWLAEQLDGWGASLLAATDAGTARFDQSRLAIDDLTARPPATDLEAAYRLSVAAGPYWVRAGVLRDAESRLAAAADGSAVVPTRIRALLGLALARISIHGGDAGILETDEALALSRSIADDGLTMQALLRRGMEGLNVGDPVAVQWVDESLAIAQRTGRRRDALIIRARLADLGQDPADAAAKLTRLLPEIRADGDSRLLGSVLNDLAANEAMTGKDRQSLAHALEAVAISENMGRPVDSAWTRTFAAAAAGRLGLVGEAASNLSISAEVALTAGPGLQGLVLGECLPALALLGQGRLAARAHAAYLAHLTTSGTVLTPGEAALLERDADLARKITNAVAWRQESEAGQTARLEAVVEQVAAVARAATTSAADGDAPVPLTRRELQVLGLVGRGLSDAAIGQELGMSPKTASVHVANAKAKLGVDTRIEAALRARELGLA